MFFGLVFPNFKILFLVKGVKERSKRGGTLTCGNFWGQTRVVKWSIQECMQPKIKRFIPVEQHQTPSEMLSRSSLTFSKCLIVKDNEIKKWFHKDMTTLQKYILPNKTLCSLNNLDPLASLLNPVNIRGGNDCKDVIKSSSLVHSFSLRALKGSAW